MTINQKPTGTASSIPKGLALSGIVGLFTTILGSIMIAYMVNAEWIAESNIGYSIMILLTVTSFIAAIIAWKKIKHRRIVVCLLAGAVYYCILLSITALFFRGQYQGMLETALLVLCGSLLAAMIGSNRKKHVHYAKPKNIYR